MLCQYSDYKAGVLDQGMKTDLLSTSKELTSKRTVKVALKTEFWLTKENTGITKYDSMIKCS